MACRYAVWHSAFRRIKQIAFEHDTISATRELIEKSTIPIIDGRHLNLYLRAVHQLVKSRLRWCHAVALFGLGFFLHVRDNVLHDVRD